MKSSIRMSALKPCPFCGEPAEADLFRGYVGYNDKRGDAVAIYCPKCPADMNFCRGDYPEQETEELYERLAECWNKRTP